MPIASLQNDTFKELMKLKQKKYREREALFLVEGEHLVKEAIQTNACVKVIGTVRPEYWTGEMILLEQELLEKLTDVESSSLIFAVCMKADADIAHDQILLLDGIQDPGNLGTLLRSACAFGFGGIVYENTVDMYNPKVLRATQGAIFKLTFKEDSLTDFINSHPEYNYIGTDVTSGKPLKDYKPTQGKLALILGNEGNGVREDLLRKTSINLKIDMKDTESLNVGVAGSILMHYLRGEK
ncbi:MAG: RNA methyltransferase [Bacilli bacterium]|nr:RNA methyltransferase [Bacilli bacterium]MBN2697062.1 RNA methyltransferase [Bacilli bacterium]